MWCPLALLGAAVLFYVVAEDPPHSRSKRLTTFGKTPTTETEIKIPRAKECKSDEDCRALDYTTCKTWENKKLCLCYDLQPPANGQCATKRRDVRGYVLIGNRRPPKGLHQGCKNDHECIEGAECVVNSTYKANEMRCYCKFGYVEEDNDCNSGSSFYPIASLVLFMALAIVTALPI